MMERDPGSPTEKQVKAVMDVVDEFAVARANATRHLENAHAVRYRDQARGLVEQALRAFFEQAPLPDAQAVRVLSGSIRDLLWAGEARPSCQKGVMQRCCCMDCANRRAREAVSAAEQAAPVPLALLEPADVDLIADDGRRNAAGGIYATRVQEFAAEVQVAFAQKHNLMPRGPTETT